MHAGSTLRTARQRAGLSLRRLAALAETSHSTLAAYEADRKVPTVETLDRIVRAAGFDLEVDLARASVTRSGGPGAGTCRRPRTRRALPGPPQRELDFRRFGRSAAA